MSKKLYEDDYVLVEPDSVKIKTYYFPTAQSRKVKYEEIKAIYWARQSFDWTETKGERDSSNHLPSFHPRMKLRMALVEMMFLDHIEDDSKSFSIDGGWGRPRTQNHSLV